VSNFPPQIDGDLESEGVCGLLIARKLKVSQPTTSRHLKMLVDVGLVEATKIGQWTFYKRNKRRVAEVRKLVNATI
jgi:ArsR family transcriptional regulator